MSISDQHPPELPPQVRPGEGQAGAARDLEGRDQGEGRARLRPVARTVRRQVPQGHRLPGSRPRRTARVLRLPRRALDAPSNHQRYRVGLRHDPPSKLASQELRHPPDHALDDRQDGSVRGEILAPAAWLPPPREGHRGSPVQRRHRGHRGPQSRRMNNPSYTRFDNRSHVAKPIIVPRNRPMSSSPAALPRLPGVPAH